MIVVRNLNVELGSKSILKGISVDMKPRELTFVIGRSGSGKSVFLKTLMGLYPYESGLIEWNHQKVWNLKENASYIFQTPTLLDSKTVLENVEFIARIKSNVPKVQQSLEFSKISKREAQSFPGDLSFGAQKRGALARCLVANSEVLFLDEPTTGLDPVSTRQLHETFLTIARDLGKTVVVVSHQLQEALEFGDHFICLEQGKKILEGTAKSVYESNEPILKKFIEVS